MSNRRNFIKKAALGSIGMTSLKSWSGALDPNQNSGSFKPVISPLIISTWDHGFQANAETLKQLNNGKTALDAIVSGVGICEADPTNKSVGYGGLPDKDGNVTLDACIMDHKSNCGSVSFLQEIKHPIAVAQKVLEKTPHVMLSGKGAQDFALSQGFLKENLLTPESEKLWTDWLEQSKYKPVINSENHDTISMLVLDEAGNLSGGCTTSGAAWKMHGRVGDSPIIGAGLFLDNDVGGAAATGLGEAVIRTAGSAIVVELMRQGKSPFEACKKIVERIYDKHKDHKDMDYLQVGFIAVDKNGIYGGYSLRSGFNYAVCDLENGNRMEDSKFKMSWNK
jgi:N4-(beta-N-acetylglucosaminyl)-L-asparaginase